MISSELPHRYSTGSQLATVLCNCCKFRERDECAADAATGAGESRDRGASSTAAELRMAVFGNTYVSEASPIAEADANRIVSSKSPKYEGADEAIAKGVPRRNTFNGELSGASRRGAPPKSPQTGVFRRSIKGFHGVFAIFLSRAYGSVRSPSSSSSSSAVSGWTDSEPLQNYILPLLQ